MVVVLVGNIPLEYRSKDLRNFFSEYTECGAFTCFHYRHRRVDENVINLIRNSDDRKRVNAQTLCTFCEVRADFLESFLKKYDNKIWYNFSNDYTHSKRVALFVITTPTNDTPTEEVPLKKFIEFNPPKILPQGNVGTSLEFFQQHINTCHMPVNVLKRLGICSSLLMNRASNIYGKVSMDYQEMFGENTPSAAAQKLLTSPNENSQLVDEEWPPLLSNRTHWLDRYHQMNDKETDAEEWDRYEALHDDVDEQQRTKPRLYEEPMEVVWEKGGSGLVYHTDDVTWRELEGKMDFDEDAADDWDVDTEIYTAASIDTNELLERTPEGTLLKLKIMKQLKKGIPQRALEPPSSSFKISKFASNQMTKYGWKHGESLGKNNSGIKCAITANYRRPGDKAGLGVFDTCDDVESLTNYLHMRKTNKPKKHFIGSIYDDTKMTKSNVAVAARGNPWKSAKPTHMKYIERDKK